MQETSCVPFQVYFLDCLRKSCKFVASYAVVQVVIQMLPLYQSILNIL